MDDTQTESSEVNFEQINRFPEEFMSFTSKATWPQIEDPKIFLSLNLDSIALDKTIKQLEALTGCRLAKSLKEPKIYIGGQSEKKCTLAISKLDILHKYQVSTGTFIAFGANFSPCSRCQHTRNTSSMAKPRKTSS